MNVSSKTTTEGVTLVMVDGINPEIVAMLQAMYSRSHKPILDRLNTLGDSEEKIKESLSKFYLGYGHQSIGDCGYTTIFIENVSMLAAKAIEDNSLFSGQEASTRYIDFTTQPIRPLNEEKDSYPSLNVLLGIQRKLVARSKEIHKELVEKYKAERPIKEGENETTYNNAMNAKAFDVVRGLLPAGVTTQLSWTTSLRKARENLLRLYLHPLKEVKDIAQQMWTLFYNAYPSSFEAEIPDAFKNDEVRDWMTEVYAKLSFFREKSIENTNSTQSIHNNVNYSGSSLNYSNAHCEKLWSLLEGRPKGAEVPNIFNQLGTIYNFEFDLDFGGFRDLHRHRVGVMPMPMLECPDDNKLHPFYMKEMEEYSEEISAYLTEIKAVGNSQGFAIETEGDPSIDIQYYIPMGCRVRVSIQYPLSQAVYVAELRSKSTVHPIVREVAKNIGEIVRNDLDIPVYLGEDHEGSIHRGTQTIHEKK
jgi:thymidylate synthase ThyX